MFFNLRVSFSDAPQMLFAAFSSVQLRNRKAIAMKSNERARCCLTVPASVDVAFLVAGRIVAICLGLLALVVGIVLSSIPWVDYLILRVSTEVAWAREDNSFAPFVTFMKNSIIEFRYRHSRVLRSRPSSRTRDAHV